ncbi:MAG: hypothetical protein GF416_04460 [Candidatus Altiarchaeales archaeon]|nr:hypothetical protein [Candidatus Altiarchaeales archaeon]MBD3416373.1 hypothetical protein [Candidatus Altiarchaeales archaeon]
MDSVEKGRPSVYLLVFLGAAVCLLAYMYVLLPGSSNNYPVKISSEYSDGWQRLGFDDRDWEVYSPQEMCRLVEWEGTDTRYIRMWVDSLPEMSFIIDRADDCIASAYSNEQLIYRRENCGSCTHCGGLRIKIPPSKEEPPYLLALKMVNSGGGTMGLRVNPSSLGCVLNLQSLVFIAIVTVLVLGLLEFLPGVRRLELAFMVFLLFLSYMSLSDRLNRHQTIGASMLANLQVSPLSLLFLFLAFSAFIMVFRRKVMSFIGWSDISLQKNSILVIMLLLGLLVRVEHANMSLDVDTRDYVGLARNILNGDTIGNKYNFHTWKTHNIGKPPLLVVPFIINLLVFGETEFATVFMSKMVSIVADLLVGLLIWDQVYSMTRNRKESLLASSLWVFNPFIIVHSAVVGKFDSVFLFFLLLALRNLGRKRFALYYVISVGVKHAPLVLVPWMLTNRKARQLMASMVLLALVLSPFILSNPSGFFGNTVVNHVRIRFYEHSWYVYLDGIRETLGFSIMQHEVIVPLMFVLFGIACLAVGFFLRPDAYSYLAFSFSAFMLVMPAIYQQELTWCMPFILIYYFTRKRSSVPIAFFLALTVFTTFNLQTPGKGPYWNLVLAALIVWFIHESFLKDLFETVSGRYRRLVGGFSGAGV